MTQQDLILGIETSCDDTSVALVGQDGTVLCCETVSQYEVHAEYGGIFPDLASRAHLQAILPTVQKALDVIDGNLDRIKAIGVTKGPGLIGSLLIGVNTAQALGIAWNKPVIGVNHLRGHLRSPDLQAEKIAYPALVLLVSGGHTLLSYMKSPSEISILGTTRDDSIGEAYDKVARMLDLGMPGGPAVDKFALRGTPVYRFPRPMIKEGYEFSFSGLKSSVARLIEREPSANKDDISASFVEACMEILEVKLLRALNEVEAKSIVVVGGVSASQQLRQRITQICEIRNVKPCLPPLTWATDNAAMIALAAWDYSEGETPLRVNPNLLVTDW